MRLTLLVLLFFLGTIQTYSQRITITGKIELTNTDESWDMNSIHIENLNSSGKVKSNEKGMFSISVKLDDELEFSGNFLESRTIKISENMLKKGFMRVELEVEEIELAEVNLNPLKKYWKDNVSKEASEQEKMHEMIGFDQEFKLDMVEGMLAIKYLKKVGGVPSYENMMRIKDQFRKGAKEYKPDVRKEKPQIIRHEEILEIQEFFTDSYFTNSLQIPAENIYEFVSFCYDTYNLKRLLHNQLYDDMFFHFTEGATRFLELMKNEK